MFEYSDNDDSDAPTEPRENCNSDEDDIVDDYVDEYTIDLEERIITLQIQLNSLVEQSEIDRSRIEGYDSIISFQAETISAQAQTIRAHEETISAYKVKVK